MRKLLFFTLLMAATPRNFGAEIDALLDKEQAQKALPILDEWKQKGGERVADYFVAGANIWRALSRKEVVAVDSVPAGKYKVGKGKGDSLTIENDRGKKVGEIHTTVEIDAQKMRKAVGFLDEGVRRFPNRLDIPVGRAYLFREQHDLPNEMASLRAFVAQARAAKSPLYGEQPPKDPVDELAVKVLNQYGREHFEADEPEPAKAVAELLVELYPKRAQGYNLLGYYQATREDWTAARREFQRALAVAPDDKLVKENIAECDRRLHAAPKK